MPAGFMHKTLLLLAACSMFSCAVMSRVTRGVQSLVPGSGDVTLDELRDHLMDFSSSFGVLVTEAADRIGLETSDTKVRRLTLLWKIRMPPLAQDAASDPDPRTGYVEALTVAVAQRQYFDDGVGKSLFGALQPIALDSAKEIEQNALRLGTSFLPPDKLDELHQEVQQLAKEHPLRGEFLRESIQAGLTKAESGGAFNDIISIPMAPFRAIAGVESGAQAIHEFNATAAQFTDIVDQLPQRLRWQMELLSYDLQEQGGVLEQSLQSLQVVAQSADRLSLAAERLPDDAREALLNASAELEARSATLKALLAEYRGAMTDTGTTAASLGPLIEALSRTSEQLNQAGTAWGGLIAELNKPNPPLPPGTPPPRPFDILDYEKTAIAISTTARDVREAVDDLRNSRAVIIEELADRVLRNGIILIAVALVAALAYRFIASRIAPTR